MVLSVLSESTAMFDCPNFVAGSPAYSRSYPCPSAIGGAATAVNKPPLFVCNGVTACAVGEIRRVATHLFAQKNNPRPSVDAQALRHLETGHGDGALGERRGQSNRLR